MSRIEKRIHQLVNPIKHIAYNEVPPRVEYRVTAYEIKFIRILDELEKLQGEIENEI